MQDDILTAMKERFGQQAIHIREKATDHILSSEPSIACCMAKADSSGPWERLSESEVVFDLDDFQVALVGPASYNAEEALQYFEEHTPWILFLLEHDRKQQDDDFLYLLMHTAKTLASKMYDENILEVVIRSVVEAITAADTGFLFLYDEQIDKLLVRSAVGFRKESYQKTRLKAGEGVSGQVFANEEPMIINGEAEIRGAMEGMSPANYRYYLASTEDRPFPDCMMSVPLRFQNETIGVLTIDSFQVHAAFTKRDLLLLETLADHVAIVITHSRLYQQEKRKREEFQRTLHALRKEHEMMQRTTDFHNRLTNIAARGEGAEAIVDTLMRTVAHPFAIYDSLLHPFYETEGAAEKSLPENFLSHDRVRYVIKTNKWQVIPAEDGNLIVLPIMGAEAVWGFLCVWAADDQLAENDIVLFEYGATVLSLELTKEEAVKEAEMNAKGELVEGILTGESRETLEVQAANLGLSTSDYYVMVLGRLKPGSVEGLMPSHIKMQKREAVQFLEEELSKRGIRGITSMNRSYIFAMVSFSEAEGKASARDQMKSLVAGLENTAVPLHIGVGRVHKNITNVNKSYTDAEKCLELLENNPGQNVISFVNAGIYRFLLQHSEEELDLFIDDILGPLLNYDQKKNGELMKTLAAYVTHDKDLKKVTQELNIHHNTLYYRISRIQEILELDAGNMDEWFNIQLAYHVYKYRNNQ
ncbi:helix-turn-helix domain-containing protein [Thalassobacillus pellis]|uniref:helix-turn-helix domain-containing protein n=1 Tax=Thalassobacillus pellis TaxID=748008 RepID=UPI0019618A72|nr:GAF domain-containing protein [Thalassobacillus pellis]MBM7551644.1 sugar diacid utilization regulator/putative methionine-R-sulfoxide reductase with GAF domain [Thalassobacillus pellis]